MRATTAATAMRALKSVSILAAVLTMSLTIAGQGTPAVYLDPAQPIDRRVDDLISKLTLAEKALAARHHRAGHRAAESSRHEWLEPEPPRHRMDQADHDVSRADRHGVDVGYGIGA